MRADQLRKLQLPLILFWQFSHFVVLEGFDDNHFYLNDPSTGRRRLSVEEFNRGYSGIALRFQRGADFSPGGEQPGLFRQLGALLDGSWGVLSWVIACALMLTLLALIVPLSLSVFVDDVLQNHGPWGGLVAALLGGGLLVYILSLLKHRFLKRLAIRISVIGFNRALSRLLRLPVEFFHHRLVGDLTDRVSSTDRIAKNLTDQFLVLVIDMAMSAVLLAAMLVYDVLLALAVLALAVLHGVAAHFLNALRAGTESGFEPGIEFTDASFSFFRSNVGDTYVAAFFELESDGITWSGNNANVSVFYNVVDALGTVIGYDEQSVDITRGPAGGPTVLEMPMQMAPGAYSIYAGILDPASQTHGTISAEIESPNFNSGGLMLSSIARFSDGSRVEDFTPEPGRALLVGGFHFIPRVSTMYAPGDALRLVFNAYGYGGGGQPNLTWQITFRKGGEQYLRYNPTAFNLASEELSIAIVDVPLARLFADGRREDFEAGDYTAEIEVKDGSSGQTVTEVIEFQVSGS
jgi:hypothetical protein